MQRIKLFTHALSAVALVVLAACGGGSGDGTSSAPAVPPVAEAPAAATMRVSGTVTGFGSVIIQGVKYDDKTAVVRADFNPAANGIGSLADVKLGVQVEGLAKGGSLTEITVRAAFAGVVASIDTASSTFTVLRQTVTVVSDGPEPTVLEGLSGLSALGVGDVVEVHGTFDANQRLVATRVERKAPSDVSQGVLISGKLVDLDASAKTFSLNGQKVGYEAATVLPADRSLADGQWVAVYASKIPAAAGALQAQAVRIAAPEEGSTSGLGGRVAEFKSVADFVISGTRVDASAAAFELGTAADLAAGTLVYVEGKVTAGLLKASKVRVFKQSADIPATLSGSITDYVSVSSFKLRGAVVDASAASFKAGTQADLGNGAFVRVTGRVRGDVLRAESVEFSAQAPAAGAANTVKLRGEVREFDAMARTFRFLGVQLQLGTGVEYVGGTAADLANGRLVDVTATAPLPPAAAASAPATRTLNVTRVEFLPVEQPGVFVAGRVNDLQDGSFKLSGAVVSLADDTTFSGGSKADLANGVDVRVQGVWNAATKTLAARKVDIRKPTDRPAGIVLAGVITDFESKASFRIGGQLVDASTATLQGGTAADLVNGVPVEGNGVVELVGGAPVAKLTALRFLR